MNPFETPPALPPNIIVLGGGWETTTLADDEPQLTLETRMRIGGLAVASRTFTPDGIGNVVYTGGLIAGGRHEAQAMLDHTDHAHPKVIQAIGKANFYLDGDCFDTSSSAKNTKTILDRIGRNDEIGFITSATHMQRALSSFQRHGFADSQLVPATAEQLLLSGNATEQQLAIGYLASMRYRKRLCIESAARVLARIDPDDRVARSLASLARYNQR